MTNLMTNLLVFVGGVIESLTLNLCTVQINVLYVFITHLEQSQQRDLYSMLHNMLRNMFHSMLRNMLHSMLVNRVII